MTTAGATPLPDAVLVLGLGLIGGSLLQRSDGIVESAGWSPGGGTRAQARAAGLTVLDDLPQAMRWARERDGLIVLAAPLTAFTDLLTEIDRRYPTARVTDVGSVKSLVRQQVSRFASRTRFVGGHPMAGTAASGFGAADPELFTGARWVTCLEQDTAVEDWLPVAGLALSVGAQVVPTTAGEHDRAVALISHLPHLLALTLAQVGAAGGPLALSLAAGSFADGTRVAGTRPELVRAMCEANRDALIDAADDALGTLGVARGSLASTGSLAKLTEAGHAGRLAFEQRGGPGESVTLTDPGPDDLLALGAVGGAVTAVTVGDNGFQVTGVRPSQS